MSWRDRLIDGGLNLAIGLLSLSALSLCLHIYPVRYEQTPEHPVLIYTASEYGGLLRPAKMALLEDMGCYVLQYDDVALYDLFGQITNPLIDVMASASTPYLVTEKEFRSVLSGAQTGVYLDFLGSIPLEGLYAWSGGGGILPEGLTGSVRRLVFIVTDEGFTQLYYINELDGMYYTCDSTAEIADRLAPLLEDIAPNAQFAFQDASQFSSLDPYNLLGFLPPKPIVYQVRNPVTRTEQEESFAETLGFHPQSAIRYAIPDGHTLRESGDTLIISQSGGVSFRATEEGEPRYPLSPKEEEGLEPWEMVDGAWALMEDVLSSVCGEARVYLIDWQMEGEKVVCYFGYLLNGTMVYVGETGYGARVVVTQGYIESFDLQLRHYTSTPETTLVLQEVRAAAALTPLSAQGSELLLAYLDQGEAILSAGWIAQ